MRQKLILAKGGTETLDFFSLQMAKEFQKLNYEIFFLDLNHIEESTASLYSSIGKSEAIFLCFNFTGLRRYPALFDVWGNYFWDAKDVACVNILVDHPYFYFELFPLSPTNFHVINIDRYHERYMHRFYPQIPTGPFMPSAGTSLYPSGDFPLFENRTLPIVFTGNYTPPSTFDSYFQRLGKEYEMFFHNILDDLLANPNQPDDIVIERHIREEIPESSDYDMHIAISNMIFIDSYIRFYFRGKVVQTILDADFPVHCVGAGWDLLPHSPSSRLTMESYCLSQQCLERQSNAWISLNVMPWFKSGAHDRIFNAMANGSLCLTDHSEYLDEIMQDQQQVLFYDLNHLSDIPTKIKGILSHPSHAEEIQQNAFSYTMKYHTWAHRAQFLHTKLFKQL